MESPRSLKVSDFFFFNDTATTEIYTLSLHDVLPICGNALAGLSRAFTGRAAPGVGKRTVLAQLVVTLSPALFILAILGATYHSATSPEAKTDTAGLIEAGGAIAADPREEVQSTGLIRAR